MKDAADQSDRPTNSAAPNSGEKGNSPSTSPFFQSADWLSFGITAVVALVMYLGTLAPEVTLEFSGILSTSANRAGVAYPPGFPVWTVYSWLFVQLLPFSNIAWRVAIGSAVAAAFACGLVALMASRGGLMLLDGVPDFTGLKLKEQNLLRIVCGFVAGMVLGLSRPVWRMAVVAETWALTVLLFAVLLCLFTRWIARPDRRRFLYGGFFVFGLLLTSNQELVVAIPALLACVLLGDRRVGRDLAMPVALLAVTAWVLSVFGRFPWLGWLPLVTFLTAGVASVAVIVQTRGFGTEWRAATVCILSVLVGLTCYFYLPITSMTNPPSNWAYPRTVEGFFHLITRGQYERPNPTGELGRFIGQLWMLTKQTCTGFGWPYFLFVALPFCVLSKMTGVASKWLIGLAAAFVCTGPLILAWLNPGQDRATLQLIESYFAPMYVVIAVWTGLGMLIIGSVLAKSSMRLPPGAGPGR